jgi:ABC-type branched-subunit amino acid transport system substrate-binding protein
MTPHHLLELGDPERSARRRGGSRGAPRALARVRDAADEVRIGMLIPMSGAAGLWGPSCLACATLAAEEWNKSGGLDGRKVSLAVIDAADESGTLEDEVDDLIGEGGIVAMVGMHTSSVRERVVRAIESRLSLVYTPLYEGGPLPPGVMAIGETPDEQLLPALAWLSARYRLTRWYLLGNDYCWPRRTHALASAALAGAGCEVSGRRFVRLGACDAERAVDDIRRSGAQAVLLSLVGQDAIDFNRAFGASRLGTRVLRLSCAIEENGLLAMGADCTEGLFVAAGYFGGLATDRNCAFRERYWTRFGDRAPTLNALGQSAYEGVAFLRGLLSGPVRRSGEVRFDSVRSTRWRSNSDKFTPIYLAQADGLSLQVVGTLGSQSRSEHAPLKT